MRRVALAAGGIVVLAAVTGASAEAVLRARAAARFPAPGRLVAVEGGRRLQLDCRGAGTPTVVLESGLDHLGAMSWVAVHDSLARTTRVCAYSRAGMMWSDRAPGRFDAARAARDLRRALDVAGERPPFVMAGHSLGGPYVTVFTGLHGTDVAGLVLVDASHPAQQARLAAALGRSVESMQPPARLLDAASALAWTGALRLSPLAVAPETWPARVRETHAAFLPQSMAALRDEAFAIGATLAEAGRAPTFGDRPLVVLTAGAAPSPAALARQGITPAQAARQQAAWRALQEEQATWSSASRHEIVPDATHYIQFERPDAVIRAVREVVARVRTGPRVRRPNASGPAAPPGVVGPPACSPRACLARAHDRPGTASGDGARLAPLRMRPRNRGVQPPERSAAGVAPPSSGDRCAASQAAAACTTLSGRSPATVGTYTT
jgi:pimeloyl-ACP methyl ester carboxylesterase